VLFRELDKAENVEGSALVYDVELVSVYDDEADLGYYQVLCFATVDARPLYAAPSHLVCIISGCRP
jgi:hypothetical protein